MHIDATTLLDIRPRDLLVEVGGALSHRGPTELGDGTAPPRTPHCGRQRCGTTPAGPIRRQPLGSRPAAVGPKKTTDGA
ncbi:hypothetical protein BBK14_03285 [Parafrankia soli]|uniref:Uncharacterized protein n=1 Tax=Parafrankia soli TaxID=2599596 RepID=A0A1S1Q3R8_9ACTN|nr:hypothetical protein BBK14_03285 [Parafrankia soli]